MYPDHLFSPLCSMAARQRFSNLIERSGLGRWFYFGGELAVTYKSSYKPFSPDVQMAVWMKTSGKCWYCGKQTDINNSINIRGEELKRKFCIDHFVSLRYGGTNSLDNLVPCCWSCNCSKHKLSLEEWRDSLRWRDIGRFTKQQVDWLRSHGITLPEPPEVVFWFERAGGPR